TLGLDLTKPWDPVAFPGLTTTYSVTATDGLCEVSDSITVNVVILEVDFNPTTDTVCLGESAQLILNGDSTLTYTWSPLDGLDLTKPWDPITTPDSTTTYYVTVTDGICTVTDSFTVNVRPLPNLSFTYETDCRSLGVNFFNTSAEGENFLWDFGVTTATDDTSNVQNPVFVYPAPGIYTVSLTSRGVCMGAVTREVTVATID